MGILRRRSPVPLVEANSGSTKHGGPEIQDESMGEVRRGPVGTGEVGKWGLSSKRDPSYKDNKCTRSLL